MKKYAKIVDKVLGLCEVGEGTNEAFYKSLGMSLRDVEKSEKDNQWYLSEKCPHYSEEEIAAQERVRKMNLNLTKADVLLALYEDKGLTPDDIKTMLKDNIPALIKFDYASTYYRGDDVVIALGKSLGYSEEDIDYLFENKKLPEKI